MLLVCLFTILLVHPEDVDVSLYLNFAENSDPWYCFSLITCLCLTGRSFIVVSEIPWKIKQMRKFQYWITRWTEVSVKQNRFSDLNCKLRWNTSNKVNGFLSLTYLLLPWNARSIIEALTAAQWHWNIKWGVILPQSWAGSEPQTPYLGFNEAWLRGALLLPNLLETYAEWISHGTCSHIPKNVIIFLLVLLNSFLCAVQGETSLFAKTSNHSFVWKASSPSSVHLSTKHFLCFFFSLQCSEDHKHNEEPPQEDEGFRAMSPLLQAHHAMERMEEFVCKVRARGNCWSNFLF